ncbi:MAG: nitroreductase family protein [Pseudoflavonifractor sp.]|nr:nitroreductase family protein [Alloprevotella sp.]MCM1116742.1 nitroreductase family protein [Pseudoflavonifractor sp.]
MKSFHDLITERRSIRRYTSEPIDPDDVRLILEAALMAPTSKSSRSWQFVCIDDRDTLTRLADCKPAYATSIKECALAIVVTADPAKSDPWIEDASIAATYMQLQAADLGLGSCWVQVYGRQTADSTPSDEFVASLLGIPEELPVLCIITIGHPAEQRKPQNLEKLSWEKIHIGAWNPQQAYL